MIQQIARETNMSTRHINGVLKLLEQGATVPFIARYRKEATGEMDEQQIIQVRDAQERIKQLEERKQYIIQAIDKQGKLTDELKQQLERADNMTHLEDLYLPFKTKRKTRAHLAEEKGLKPLAAMIMSDNNHSEPEKMAKEFINPNKGLHSIHDALEGAGYIMAAWMNERTRARTLLRKWIWKNAAIKSKNNPNSKKEEKENLNFKDYFSFSARISRISSHQVLAMFRGEKEGILKVALVTDQQQIYNELASVFVNQSEAHCRRLVEDALKDAIKRLMLPSMETEVRAKLKERSDDKAISVFKNNVYQILMEPPLGPARIMAIDPGFRSGCKVVCLDQQGNLLENDNIYPHPPQNQVQKASGKLRTLVEGHKIQVIAVGDGTAGRETGRFIEKIPFQREVKSVMVSENGASVYSASKLAREEFPQYDVTVRGAVSIGRRLMDPLAELVKIDPRSIGVGQYQHDVDQNKLNKSLSEAVMQAVNAVGVEVNTASKELLAYVSGIGPAVADNMVKYRKINGPFTQRKELMNVKGLGKKAYEQAAGFLKIKNGKEPLDQSAVHPESYHIVNEMAKKLKISTTQLVGNKKILKELNPQEFVTKETGIPTIKDIINELEKPGRDPRGSLENFQYSNDIKSLEDIREGMILPGKVNNITAFGCFVDLGIDVNGLVHLSQMANRFVDDPASVVVMNQSIRVKVLQVDKDRRRISLSMKEVQ